MHPKEDENYPAPHEVVLPGIPAQLYKDRVIDGDAVAQLHKQPVARARSTHSGVPHYYLVGYWSGKL